MLSQASLAALRIFMGLSLALAHGFSKMPPSAAFIETVRNLGFPAAESFAWAAAGAEFFGGLLLALGLFTRPAALLIFCTMLVAAFGRHGSDAFQAKELALFYLFSAGVFLARGSEGYSVDSVIASRR